MNNLLLLHEKTIGCSGLASGARGRYSAPLFSGKLPDEELEVI